MSSIEKNNENLNESPNKDNNLKKDENNNDNVNLNKSEGLLNVDFEILPLDYAKPDHTYKIIVIGNSGVGKTCLTYRIITGKFQEIECPTLGFEFFPFLVKYKDKIINYFSKSFLLPINIYLVVGEQLFLHCLIHSGIESKVFLSSIE